MKRRLGQIRPDDTNANVVITNPQEQNIEVTCILICETSGAATTFDIYANKSNIDSKTYDEDSAIFFEAPIEANETIHISGEDLIVLDDASCTVAVKVGTADTVNFTFNGNIT